MAGAASKKLDELYMYDNLNRLVGFQRGGLDQNKTAIATASGNRLRGEAWTLSPTGNWNAYKVDVNGSGGTADGDYNDTGDLDQTREHNKANEIEDQDQDGHGIETAYGTAWADPVHDVRGNMTSVPRPGDMTAVYACTYDAWNRLTKVVAGQTTVAEYRYDGLNRRIRKYTDKSDDNWTVREYYYNVSWQALQIDKDTEDRTGGVEPAVADVLNEQYVWSPRYVDAPILRDRDSDSDGNPDDGDLGKTDSGLDERLYYLTDAQMNVTALVDTGGDAVERYAYDAYGRVTVLNGASGVGKDGQVTEWTEDTGGVSDVANEVLYCGYRLDSETGLYHVRHRVYHPLLGRWLQRDPLGYVDGMGLYEYCGGGPLGATDPLGLAEGWWNQLKQAVGGIWAVGPYDAYRVGFGDINDLARDTAVKIEKECPDTEDNALANAVRHLVWQAKLTREFGAEKAKQIGDLHELGDAESSNAGVRTDTKIDQHNNAIGREIGEKATSDEDIVRLVKVALDEGRPITDTRDPRLGTGSNAAPTGSSSSGTKDSSDSSNSSGVDSSNDPAYSDSSQPSRLWK